MIKVFWTIGLLAVTFGFFHNMKSFYKLFMRYVFDGADSRVPYIIALFTFNLVLHLEIYYFLFYAYVSPLLIFQMQVYSFIWATYLFKSRLSGYTTMTISKCVKNNAYIAFTVAFWIILFLLFLNFNPNIVAIPTNITLFSQDHWEIFLNIFKFNYFGKVNMPFFLISIIIPACLYWFDAYERRWKYLRINSVFLIPIILFALSYFGCPLDWLIVAFGIAYLLFPTLLLQKEVKSIIRHSNRIDTRINQINKIINEIVKICPQCAGHCIIRNENCKMNTKQRFQIKLIAKMIIDDPNLEDIIMKKHFFNQKKYKNVYEKINYAIVSERERLQNLQKSLI